MLSASSHLDARFMGADDVPSPTFPTTAQPISIWHKDGYDPLKTSFHGEKSYLPKIQPAINSFLLDKKSIVLTHYFHSSASFALAKLLSLEKQQHIDISSLRFVDPIIEDKVNSLMRDEALSQLRSLHHVFYELSPMTFCKAVLLIDNFISKVKVKPKYMMCVTAASYYIASKFECAKQPWLTLDSLARMSHCGGTSADLVMMIDIILKKIGHSFVAMVGASSATALDFISLFVKIYIAQSRQFIEDEHIFIESNIPTFLARQLEEAMCVTNCASFRPPCIALALLLAQNNNCSSLRSDNQIFNSSTENNHGFSLSDLYNLANLCKVPWSRVELCVQTMHDSGTLGNYYTSHTKPLSFLSSSVIWNLSRRTVQGLSGSKPPNLSAITEWIEE